MAHDGVSGRGRASAWDDAVLAAMLLATDPTGLGLVLRAPAGPVRDHWLQCLGAMLAQHEPPVRPRRVPLSISDERLLGGLDLTATLQAGRPVAQRGLLAEADGSLLLVSMAERLPPGLTGHLAAMLDQREVRVERDGISTRLPARCGLLLLDESAGDDEGVPPALADRLALHLDLTAVTPREALATPIEDLAALADIAAAQQRLARVAAADPRDGEFEPASQQPIQEAEQGGAAETLCAAADALGVDSLRAVLGALRAARVHAALAGAEVGEDAAPTADDLRVALRLVLLPRATRLPQAAAEKDEAADEPEPAPPPAEADTDQPAPPPEAQAPPPADSDRDPAPAPESTPDPAEGTRPPAELLLEAALAALPPDLLLRLRSGSAARGRSRGGGAGQLQRGAARGRPAGVRRALPRAGQRLNLVETLRAAIPWQRLRERPAALRLAALPLQAVSAPASTVAAQAGHPDAASATSPRRRIQVRPEDFHVTQLQQPRQTTTIFAVDASGSSALGRLAEAKGAVELLLADCYVRRDRVAVIGFRGRTAEVLLPPTRSLVRAKRSLAGLAGGGGTPLASALQAAAGLADAVQRRGETAVLVLLTDGRANVALDGTGGRARAEAEAMLAAQQLRLLGATVLLIDTSPQPQPAAARLAQALHARYLPLPQADAQRLSQAVRAAV